MFGSLQLYGTQVYRGTIGYTSPGAHGMSHHRHERAVRTASRYRSGAGCSGSGTPPRRGSGRPKNECVARIQLHDLPLATLVERVVGKPRPILQHREHHVKTPTWQCGLFFECFGAPCTAWPSSARMGQTVRPSMRARYDWKTETEAKNGNAQIVPLQGIP